MSSLAPSRVWRIFRKSRTISGVSIVPTYRGRRCRTASLPQREDVTAIALPRRKRLALPHVPSEAPENRDEAARGGEPHAVVHARDAGRPQEFHDVYIDKVDALEELQVGLGPGDLKNEREAAADLHVGNVNGDDAQEVLPERVVLAEQPPDAAAENVDHCRHDEQHTPDHADANGEGPARALPALAGLPVVAFAACAEHVLCASQASSVAPAKIRMPCSDAGVGVRTLAERVAIRGPGNAPVSPPRYQIPVRGGGRTGPWGASAASPGPGTVPPVARNSATPQSSAVLHAAVGVDHRPPVRVSPSKARTRVK